MKNQILRNESQYEVKGEYQIQHQHSDINQQNTQDIQDDEFTEIYVWGNDFYGQLGVGSEKCIHRLPKVCSFNIVISQVSCGEEHTAFISKNGGHVYTMGSNSEGKLGVGDKQLKLSNIPCLVDSLKEVVKVSCGMSHTLAINKQGQAFAWGQGFYGALGLSKKGLETFYSPNLIESLSFEKIIDISAGSRHSLLLSKSYKVFACGDTKSGQLGMGIQQQKDRILNPTQIQHLKDQKISKICCGKFHSLFLTKDNQVYACGSNNFGQLGTGNKQNQYEPVLIKALNNVAFLSAWHFTAAITKQNELYICGTGIFGEFLTPKLMNFKNIEDNKIKSVNVGGSFTVLTDMNKRTMVWGANTNGEMGLGDTQPRINPAFIEPIKDKEVSFVGVGSSYAFALGPLVRNHENYQSYITEDSQQVMITQNNSGPIQNTVNIDSQKDFIKQTLINDSANLVKNNSQTSEVTSNIQYYEDANCRKQDLYKNQMLQEEIQTLNMHLNDKEKQIQCLNQDNASLKSELNQRKNQTLSSLQKQLDQAKIKEQNFQSKISDLESQHQKFRDYDQIKSELETLKIENEKVKRERDELNQKLSRQQQQNTFKDLPENKSYQLLNKESSKDNIEATLRNSPSTLGQFGKQMQSPQTTAHKRQLTMDDLENKHEKPNSYNPVWKLQVTDDERKVLYQNKFVDRNAGERDFKFDPEMPKYDDYMQNRVKQQSEEKYKRFDRKQFNNMDEEYRRMFTEERRDRYRQQQDDNYAIDTMKAYEKQDILKDRDLNRYKPVEKINNNIGNYQGMKYNKERENKIGNNKHERKVDQENREFRHEFNNKYQNYEIKRHYEPNFYRNNIERRLIDNDRVEIKDQVKDFRNTQEDWKQNEKIEKRDQFKIKLQPVDQINTQEEFRKPDRFHDKQLLLNDNRVDNKYDYRSYERVQSPPVYQRDYMFQKEYQPLNYKRF